MSRPNPEAKFFNAFNLVPATGPARFKNLLDYFGSLSKAWQSAPQDMKKTGLNEEWINQWQAKKAVLDPEREVEKLKKEEIKIITWSDDDYPKRLKEIFGPPYIIYVRGEIIAGDEFALGVVGSRNLSIYGEQAAPDLVEGLARAGLTIISGLARGIDTIAHKTALERGGRTIAVIGSGLDWQSIYPPQNRPLVEKIIAQNQGAIISEFPAGTLPLAHHFPLRNRIISGLSLGILVIEAEEKSGALITASHALFQNREVFALPGSIYSKHSRGPNNLIKQGAKLVQNVNDILEELNLKEITLPGERKITAGSPEEEKILNCLSGQPRHIDQIIELAGLEAGTTGALLTQMEIEGKIKGLGGMNYIKN